MRRRRDLWQITFHTCRNIAVSSSGWIDDDHCRKWLQQSFLPQANARNISGKAILLTCDGHGSHCTDQLIAEAYNKNVIVLVFPPHCTHKLQPLDVGVLGPLQTAFTNEVDKHVLDFGVGISKSDFITLYTRAQRKAITPDLITKAFKHCGINPLNPNIFNDDDFAPSQGFSTVTSSLLPSSYPTSQEPGLTEPVDSDLGSAGVDTSASESETDSDSGSDSRSFSGSRTASSMPNPSRTIAEASSSSSCRLPMPSPSYDSMSRVELLALLAAKNDELKVLKAAEGTAREAAERASAHAVIAGQQFADLQRERNAKAKSRVRGALNTKARVINSAEEIARITAEQAEKQKWDEARAEHEANRLSFPLWAKFAESIATARAQLCDGHKTAMKQRQGFHKLVSKALKARNELLKKAAQQDERRAKQAERDMKKSQEREEKQVKRSEVKAARDRKREEDAARKARAKAERAAAAAQKTLAPKKVTTGKRMGPVESDNRDPKRKRVNEGAVEAGKENVNLGAKDNSPSPESQLNTPLTSPTHQNRLKPAPHPRFRGVRALDVTNGEEGQASESSFGIASVLGL
jgi:hypothetical protein